MNDHAARIRAKLQKKQVAALLLAGLALVFLVAFLTYRGLTFAQRYAGIEADHRAMVQCLNGHYIRIGDAIMHCEIARYRLVPGIPAGGRS